MSLLKSAKIALVVLFVCLLFPTVAQAKIPHYSQKHSKHHIRVEAKKAHYGKVQTKALITLAYRESRWHNWSHSRSECHGLFQLSRGMAHGRKWWKPGWNTRRAIRYIKHRYGTPAKALEHSKKYGWY